MSSEITTTKELLSTGEWRVTAEVEDNGTLPKEIFLYEVTPEGTLGVYFGVCDREQLGSRAIWTGDPVPTFGNTYVRHTPMTREYPTEAVADQVIDKIVTDATSLSAELANATAEVIIHPIP